MSIVPQDVAGDCTNAYMSSKWSFQQAFRAQKAWSISFKRHATLGPANRYLSISLAVVISVSRPYALIMRNHIRYLISAVTSTFPYITSSISLVVVARLPFTTALARLPFRDLK